jgi:hypothetical protein
MPKYWEMAPEQGDEGVVLRLVDPEGWYEAYVKWDGCVDFMRLHNVPLPYTGEPTQGRDYIHFCDLDEEIERLQALRELARLEFGEGWSDV